MKIKKVSATIIGLGALAIALCFNFMYASNDYGISDNSLSVQVLAQVNQSGTVSDPALMYKYEYREESQNKITITCNRKMHERYEVAGFQATCSGTGNVTCQNRSGWYSIGTAFGFATSVCPAVNGQICYIR